MGIRIFGLTLLAGASIALTLPYPSQEQPSRPASTQTAPGNSDANAPRSAEGSEQKNPETDSKPRPAASNLDLTPDASGNLSQEQMRELVRVVAQNYRDNYSKQRNYTYVERDVERKLTGGGEVKSTESKTFEVMQLYGEQVYRLIEKNDKPLDPKDAAKEEEKLQKLADKRKNESEEERLKREEAREKQHEKNREFVSEIADAYDFRLAGSETLNGRDVWVIAGEPRAEFRAHLKEAEMLSRVRGTLWIDKNEKQLAKMDIEVLDTLTFGWILARIHKGTRITYEQMRVNDEVWLPLHLQAKVDMRLALFKSDNEEDENTYRDYKKFRASTKILDMGEVEQH